MPHTISAGTVVVANNAYEVVVGGDYDLADLVLCRRVIDTNGPVCAFLAASVLGIELQESEE
jgi:hypothetical protein